MSRIKLAAVVVVCGAIAVAAYSQAASGGGVRTRFDAYSTTISPIRGGASVKLFGRVGARPHKCRAHRRAVLYFNRIDRRHLGDSDRSSRHGAVALVGEWHAAPRRIFVIVYQKRIGPHSRCLRFRYLRSY
jgi:hypothetical protein